MTMNCPLCGALMVWLNGSQMVAIKPALLTLVFLFLFEIDYLSLL